MLLKKYYYLCTTYRSIGCIAPGRRKFIPNHKNKTTIMWKCKICGAVVAPNGTAVSAHFEKHHFSIFLSKSSELRRIPKAFLRDVTPGAEKAKPAAATATPDKPEPKKAPKPQTTEQQETNAVRYRTNNLTWLIDQIRDIDRDHTFEYREPHDFVCPCCNRTMAKGKRLKHDRENYIDICHDCFKAARRAITTGK